MLQTHGSYKIQENQGDSKVILYSEVQSRSWRPMLMELPDRRRLRLSIPRAPRATGNGSHPAQTLLMRKSLRVSKRKRTARVLPVRPMSEGPGWPLDVTVKSRKVPPRQSSRLRCPRAAGSQPARRQRQRRGLEAWKLLLFLLLFSHYFEEFCKVQSAEAKLFKGGVKFRTAGKQSEILALSFLSKKSLYPTHRSRQPLGHGVCLDIQGVGICRRLDFAAINARGVEKEKRFFHWHEQTGLILNQSNESCCDLGLVLRTFLPQCTVRCFTFLLYLKNTHSILSRYLDNVLLKEDINVFLQESPISFYLQLWRHVCVLWTECTPLYF